MIVFDIDEKNCVVKVTGHAGFGDVGLDIVCAGASMLFFAFADSERRAARLLEIKAEPGDSMVRWRRSSASSRRLEVLEAGALLLQRQYADYVQVRIGEKSKPGI